MSDLSLILAISFGIVTAVPGVLPAAGLALVTWSRVVSGVGWLGYAGGVVLAGGIPDAIVPGILAAQAGYGMAVVAIGIQACRNR